MMVESVQQINFKIDPIEKFILQDAIDVLEKMYDLIPAIEAAHSLRVDVCDKIEFLQSIVDENGITVKLSSIAES